MSDQPRPGENAETHPPAPNVRRGRGLQLSTHTPPDEPAGPKPAPAQPKRRGRGLQLSTHAPATASADLGSLPPAQRAQLAHGEVCYRQAGAGPPLLLIHGRQDAVVDYRHVQALFAAARAPRFRLRHDGPHIGSFREPAIRSALLQFLADPADGCGTAAPGLCRNDDSP
jgi:fermentation-respiration switch protein FrsA (DUF1100 family)